MSTALLVHGVTNGPACMWRFQEWLEDRGWEVEAKAQLGRGGRGPAPSYTMADFGADNVAMGDHDLVIGHSLGAGSALLAEAARPQWTRRLVLIEPALYVDERGNGVTLEGQLAELAQDADQIRANHPTWDERDIQAKAAENKRVHIPAIEGFFGQAQGWDFFGQAEAITVPTLLITGDPSMFTITPPEHARRVVDANPNVTWVMIEGAGHNPHRDRPERVGEVLLAWLDRTPAPAA